VKLFAMLTCDEVLIDGKTGKHSIIGHFSSIKAAGFPVTHPSLTLFVGLTDIPAGDHELEIKFGLPSAAAVAPAPKKNKSFWGSQTPPAPPPDPMKSILKETLTSRGSDQRIYFLAELRELTFDREGDYQIALLVDKAAAGSVDLSVGK